MHINFNLTHSKKIPALRPEGGCFYNYTKLLLSFKPYESDDRWHVVIVYNRVFRKVLIVIICRF